MAGRLIAVGDVHGYAASLSALLKAIAPEADDTLVMLGDYVDRGPDTPGVMEQILVLKDRCRLVPILGNHDEMLLMVRDGHPGIEEWIAYGGETTLRAYGCEHPRDIPAEHVHFLRNCVSHFEGPRHFFVHASYLADQPLEGQPGEILRWASIRRNPPGPHCSGKIAIVGHTAQRDFEILDLGHLKCIDTACYCGGWLTALEPETGCLWQVDGQGRMRGER